MPLKCKCKHVYAVPHQVVSKKLVEEVDADNYPVERYEDVNLLTHQEIETPHYRNYLLDAQLAANQPIKRVNTLTLEPTEISQSQLNQLAYRFDKAREELVNRSEQSKNE